MRLQYFLSLCLVSFHLSLAEQIPPDHVLWGAKIPFSTPTSPALQDRAQTPDPVCLNAAKSRKCWNQDFSVATDFDVSSPPGGKNVPYNLEITNTTCAPDGSPPRTCLLINNQFPGPTIRANWGDTLTVTVKNSMQDNGTGIHWHGIRQLNSVYMDGVGGITECPLAPGDTKTYTFKLTQHGTTWYHSHFSSQYGDGVFGALIIDGPATDNYDVDLGPYMVGDWWNSTTAFSVDSQALQVFTGTPTASTILVNGTNKNALGRGRYSTTVIKKGQKYLLRLINPSVDTTIRVSLDGHKFKVVTSDLVPIVPYDTDWLLIGIGQRYNVIITADQAIGNYWFRAVPETNCVGSRSYINGAGIFRYETAPATDPTSTSTATKPNNCNDESPLVPYSQFANPVPSTEFINQVQHLSVDNGLSVTTNTQNIVKWAVNTSAISVDWETPILSHVIAGDHSYKTTDNLVFINESIWTYWIIQANQKNFPVAHPMHLHGHDFYILGTGPSIFDNSSISTLNFKNPPRRDVATLPPLGWLLIAFPTDNPGAWLMHCHIGFHVAGGLGVNFLESNSTIVAPPAGYSNTCAKWKAYQDSGPYWLPKTDSGL